MPDDSASAPEARPRPPDDPDLADDAITLRGAYVHVPFCARICPYCDFAVVAGMEHERDRYLEALHAEIAMEPPWWQLDALHVGGGTPSQLTPQALGELGSRLDERFGFAAGAERGIEANPEDFSPAYAEGLARAGFDRVSLGAQSLDGAVLAELGRRHRPQDIPDAVNAARAAGLRSVNVDLILGSPVEEMASWRATVESMIAMAPDHISVYALTVERGTPLGRAVAAGAPGPDPDAQAERFEAAAVLLTAAGYVRYEVSNYARPGHHSRYNLLTWAGGEYLAFGNGAHGHRDGVRRRNHRKLEAYLAGVESGQRPEAGTERLAGWEKERETMMLGLRRSAGISAASPLVACLLDTDWGERLVAAGVIGIVEDRMVVKRPLLTDEVARAVLALSPGDC